MPVQGLPSISSLATRASEIVSSTATYLQIPQYEEYVTACHVAARDIITSSKSSWHLLVLSLTPLCIILKLICKMFLVGLSVIAEHSLKHGVVAAREGAGQVRTGMTWFVTWQNSLSPAAIVTELAALVACVGLYMIRRHIQKYKYVERVQRWCRIKRNEVLKKYNDVVRTVSETSVVLALLLPHLLYVVGVVFLKYAAPWLLRYFAMHTPTVNIITIWIPLVRTVSFLHRWSSKDGNAEDMEEEQKAEAVGGAASPTTRPARTTRSATGRAADRYLQATMKSANGSSSAQKKKKRQEYISADNAIRDEGMDLLRYWVVYALLCALFRALAMLPVVGNLVIAAATTTTQGKSRWAPKPGRMRKALPSLRPTVQWLKETKLVFFVWLLYLPTSLTTAAVESNSGKGKEGRGVKAKVSAWENKIGSGDLNRPINIVYKRFAPVAVSVADFSLTLTQEGRSQNGAGNATQQTSAASSALARLLTKGIGFIRSVLEMTVFMRIISPSTRDWILKAIADGAALLPAAITLVMPGYFTEFGVLYVSNVVPAANSTIARDTEDGASMARYLQYWVIHTLLSGLLASFRPVLAWIPLSTHLTWVLWAYVQLEPVTAGLYAIVEWEVTAFGLLRARRNKNGDETSAPDIDNTLTLQLLRRVSSVLPKAKDSLQEKGKSNGEEKEGEAPGEATHVANNVHEKVD